MIFDSNLLLAFIYLPYFLHHLWYPGINASYSTIDILLTNLAQALIVGAVLSLGCALPHGKAGVVQAISNCKIVV